MRHQSLRALGVAVACVFFALWGIALLALLAPAVLVGAVAARILRSSYLAERHAPRHPLVIDGEYEVVREEKGDVYAVAYSKNGVHFEVTVNPDGKVARIEEKVSYKPLPSMRDLPRLVAGTRAGETAKIELWRDGRKQSASVTIGELKPEMVASAAESQTMPGGVASKALGAQLATLDESAKAQLNLPESTTGVIIAQIDPDGRGAAAGLQPGDVIEKVGSKTVTSPADVDTAFAKTSNNAVLPLINRRGNEIFVGMKLADA